MTSSGIADKIDVRLKSFPYPPYLDDAFIFILTTQLPFIIMLSFIVTAPTICKDVVLEKEKKLKVCKGLFISVFVGAVWPLECFQQQLMLLYITYLL
jgi:hypothetical protein